MHKCTHNRKHNIPNKQTTVRAANNANALDRGVVLCDQPFARRNEIIKHVLLPGKSKMRLGQKTKNIQSAPSPLLLESAVCM